MKPILFLALAPLACSVDWDLARHSDTSGPDASPDPVGVIPSVFELCADVPALDADPVIDGNLEPGLTRHVWLDEISPEAPDGIAVYVAMGYRPGGLYFFIDVEDPTRNPAPLDTLPYCGDGVELFVDDDGAIQNPPGYDTPGTVQFIVAAPMDAATPSQRGQRFTFLGTSSDGTDLGVWTSSGFVASPTPLGYAVEAFVGGGDLDLDSWTLASGGKIGWNMSLNIGGPQEPGIDACTTRNQQIHLRLAASGDCTAPYCNAAALCSPTLATP